MQSRFLVLAVALSFDLVLTSFLYIAIARGSSLGFSEYTRRSFTQYHFAQSLVDVVLFDLIRALIYLAVAVLALARGPNKHTNIRFVILNAFGQVGLCIAKTSQMDFGIFSAGIQPWVYLLFVALFVLPLVDGFFALSVPSKKLLLASERTPLLNESRASGVSINVENYDEDNDKPESLRNSRHHDDQSDSHSWSSEHFFVATEYVEPASPASEDLSGAELQGNHTPTDLVTKFTTALTQIEHLYNHSRVTKAAKLLTVTRNALRHHMSNRHVTHLTGGDMTAAAAFDQIAALMRQAESRHHHIEHEAAMLKLFLASTDNDEGWILQGETNGIRIDYQHREGSATHTIRAKGTVEADTVCLLVVATELDLLGTWFPSFTFPLKFGMQKSTRVARVAPLHDLTYVAASVPWPFADRDLTINLVFENRLNDDGTLVVAFETVEMYSGVTLPAPTEGVVRIDLTGGLVFRPIDRHHVQIQMVWDLDPKISVIPAAVLNFLIKKVIKHGLTMYTEIARKIQGTPYEVRLNADPHYAELSAKIRALHSLR
ncbi:hypothetical protein CAOG_04487 [Capsaspora owczarzaki ATCC 30864]|uniref:MENTAL domain-containing protein n=1 Tax=Capsaspora owczarzaki (strain ATCC 30864) TaxID=595528 RepID=A0A0D2VRY8_CAPO3|nr:hypothetical protein CAOG_04487 [Capsaspora owczarzaki ATCC 30864]KJE93737.1 hypothetical protein CAOG_004487 [Capsaspora owczarzaki ATCC 30864]|eukprot:XP_004348315.1 hypothetical protein CAOG_04487 [Capsaspora owczarzaki ATCC 30864]